MPDAARLWKLNHRLVTLALQAATGELAALGLETKEFFVLDEVPSSPYPAALADELVIPRASVTSYVRSLVAKGLLARDFDETDLRRHRLALTEEGRRVLALARDVIAAGFEARLDRIGDRDRRELARIVETMLSDAASAARRPVAGEDR